MPEIKGRNKFRRYAVGITIQNTGANRQATDKIIVVIVTDGHENSSREWDKDKVHSAIDSRLNEGNWSFTYLGTHPETWDDAAVLGMTLGATARYAPTRAHAAYAAVARSVSRLAADKSRLGTRTLMEDYMPEKEAREAGIQQNPESKSESGLENEAKKGMNWR